MITPPLIKLYAIVDRGMTIPITKDQRDKLVRLKMIYPRSDVEGWYRIADDMTIADIDFVL